jgi:hypothetical protein
MRNKSSRLTSPTRIPFPRSCAYSGEIAFECLLKCSPKFREFSALPSLATLGVFWQNHLL